MVCVPGVLSTLDSSLKYVAVQSWDESEELWGMKEEDFMKYAVRVERNTNKVLDEDEGTAD